MAIHSRWRRWHAPGSPPTPVLGNVRNVSGVGLLGGTGHLVTNTFTAAVPAGDSVIVTGLRNFGDLVGAAVTDSRGNSYQLDVANAAVSPRTMVVLSGRVTTPIQVGDTYTLSYTNNNFVDHQTQAFAVTGLAASGWFEGSQVDQLTNATNVITTAKTNVSAKALLVGVCSIGNARTFASVAPWTELQEYSAGAQWLSTQYQIVSTSAARSTNFVLSPSFDTVTAAMLIYKGA